MMYGFYEMNQNQNIANIQKTTLKNNKKQQYKKNVLKKHIKGAVVNV